MPAPIYPLEHRRGIHLLPLDLWLDPRDAREVAVVSHAHGDHVARHEEVICTEPTHRILSHRLPAPRSGRRGSPRGRVVAYGEEVPWREARISLHPAGHVLGAAQVLVRHRGLRILYSGDIRVRPSRTCVPLETVECDVLVVESTFGSPGYRFPPSDDVTRSICAFCVETLERGASPVLLGYSLGKGQELLACLREAGCPIALHPALHDVTEIYRSLGVDLPEASRLDESTPHPCVVIAPPQARSGALIEGIQRRRTAYVSGWAVHRMAGWRLGCDTSFALSDHADFGELVGYVLRSRARRVYTVFGFAAELAQALRRRRIAASPLADPEQLTLELDAA